MPRVKALDLDCHYVEDYFGPQWQTPDVVLLQAGYAANANHFAEWVPGLASRYRVIRRDSVGHGLTSPGDEGRDLSLPALARDIVAFMDAIGVEKLHYVGERTGAMTGVVLASQFPDRVHSLTIFGCPIVCGEPLQQAMWHKLGAAEQQQYTGWCDAMAGLGGAFAWHDHVNWLADEDRPDYSAWQTEQLHLCDEALLERYAFATVSYDIAPFLESVKVPTLIVAPTTTYRTNLAQQVILRETISDSELMIVEGSEGRADDGNGALITSRLGSFLSARFDR